MPPHGGGKRKRGDRIYSQDDVARPSPHRPGNLELGRQNYPQSPTNNRDGYDNRRGYGRHSRGGRGFGNAMSPTQSTAVIDKVPTSTSSETHPMPLRAATPDPINIERSVARIYCYEHVTKELQENWDTQGRDTVRQMLLKSEDHMHLVGIIQELIQAASTSAIPAREAGEMLRSLMDGDARVPSPSQRSLLDAISVAVEEDQTLLSESLIEFLAAIQIDDDLLRLELDQPLLLKLGLISGRFKQMGIRKQTNTLYRQANFNLMREESEGFAKLITELFTTSGNELPTGEVVHDTVEKVKAMIGAFDLDVGRSLDVILDVFGSVLVRHNRFLVKLLRASPWWPQSVDGENLVTGGLPRWASPSASDFYLSELDKEQMREASEARDVAFWPQASMDGLLAFQQVGRVRASLEALEAAQNSPEESSSKWILATGTLPPTGNRDAAQLLGFKLRFYSSSAARGPQDNLPDNLIHLSALLIKIGFISLNDLYAHIWRPDEEMEELRKQKLTEKADRERAARPGAGAKNALAMAGALADDTLPIPAPRLREPTTRASTPAKDVEAEKMSVKEISTDPADQKVLLLKSLLAVGALPEALFILGRFPWVLDLYPELPEYVHRILHHCLDRVYEGLRPLKSRDSLRSQKPIAETDVPGITKGQVRLSDLPLKKTLKWAFLDRNDSGDGTDYRFYWDDWSDSIPVCQNVDDVFTLCSTLLPLVGVKIGQDPTLVLKLARIGKSSLQEDDSVSNRKRWLDLIKRILLPCLSLTRSNAGVINEVFELMAPYPTATRYLMYLEWSSGRISRLPDIATAFEQARAETKDILKRISKTNVKPMARSLAKIAYANPHVVISTALTQIESYDSIADVFVEGARYFTDLGYDVLTWALIISMGRAGRSRTQDGGIFASRWLSALSQFAGKIYKRYSMMKAGPVLQYVAEQLERGNTTDLKMLEQLVVSMAGIATDTNFNDAQLQAMGGGPLLQSQTILQLLDRRSDSKITSKRLIKALYDDRLTARILISMAQQRQYCVFDDANIPLKAIGNTFDELSRVMSQYIDLLRANLTAEEFEHAVPDVTRLLIDYQISPEVAFGIQRPLINRKIAEVDRENHENQKMNGTKNSVDVEMDDQDASEEDGEEVENEVITAVATPSDMEINGAVDTDTEAKEMSDQWHPVLKPIMDSLYDHVALEVVDVIGLGFYVTFWQLSLYDIVVPSKSYEDEMGRQRKKIAAITADRSNVSASGARAREANIKQHQQIIDALLVENKQHLKACNEIKIRLQREKDQWFAHRQRQVEAINVALMEHCFLPRVLTSPLDAFFCFKFIKHLHVNSTPNFRTLGCYDRFLKAERLTSLFFMCTSQESDNLGRFLRELLQDVHRWHKDKHVYEKEAFGSKRNLVGFALKIDNGKPIVFLEYESFRRLVFKWHASIFSALTKCLASTDYMHARNAISVLRGLSLVYPSVNFHGMSLQKAVEKLRNSDRDDLKVAAGALLGALHRREKEWVPSQSFTQGQEGIVDSKPPTNDKDKTANQDDGETGEIEMTDIKSEGIKPEVPSRATPKVVESVKDSTRAGSARPETTRLDPTRPSASVGGPPSTSRPSSDTGYPDRRGRPHETERSQNLPRKLSPPRHQPPANLPSRPEADSRNGYRNSPRISARQDEIVRSEDRAGYSRYGPERSQEATYEQSHRHSRTHDRSSVLDRDDRPRREHETRYEHERDARGEKESKDYSRGPDRVSGREHSRSQPDPDRRRPDLMDDHRGLPGRSLNQSGMANSRSVQPAAVGINPERAALINSEPKSDISIRGQAQDKARSSRPASPKREDDRRHQNRYEREERSERREPNRNAQTSQQTTRPSPGSFNRETRQPPPIDMRHGRLEPESPQHSRIEPQPEPEVPSGPRANTSSRIRPVPVSTPQPIRTPVGPASHARNTPVQEKPQDNVSVHPDRMNQIASEAPRGPQRVNSQVTPPLGPRNAPPSQSGPSPTSRGPPTGPQSDGSGRSRRAIDNLNNTLVQAQGPQGRGRGMRQNSGQMPQMPPPGPASRPYQTDPSNPNGMPIQPRPSSARRDSKDEDIRSRNGKDRRNEEPRRGERRDEASREQRAPRTGEELPPRKHAREDGPHHTNYPRGGSRNVSDNKRPRRGG